MFKKIKENEKVQYLKELWKNPKTHNIAVLVFWLVFITIVIIFARATTSPTSYQPQEQINLSNFSDIKSYEFTYKASDLEISGQSYDNAIVFYLNNKKYYYNNNIYLIDEKPIQTNDFDLNVLKITSKFLNNLVSGITPTDNNTFKQYIIPLDRFINLYEIDTDVDLSKAATYNVIVSVYLTNNEINKVVLDLSNYYTLKNNIQINYPLTIYYYNINNVSDFRKGYDKVVEVES